MIPFHDQKKVYIANPKTGTSAMYEKYGHDGDPFVRHAKFSEIWWRFEGYKSVVVVRNPVDWVVSWYRFLSKGTAWNYPYTWPISFNSFVRLWLNGHPFWRDNCVFQSEYFEDEDSGRIAEIILPYTRDNRLLEKELGVSLRRRVNPGVGDPPVIPPALREEILQYAERDYRVWIEACERYGVDHA